MSVFGSNDLFDHFDHSGDEETVDNYDWEKLAQYQEENLKLKLENEKLKKVLRILAQPLTVSIQDPSKDGPAAQLILYNSNISRNERESIESLFRHCLFREKSKDAVLLPPQSNAIQCPFFTKNSNRNRSKIVDKAYVITNSIQFYSKQFCIDKLGDPLAENQRLLLKVPEYERKCLDILDGKAYQEEKKENKLTRVCFNCGLDDHQLKDCPTPKNFKAINERKQKFLSQINSSPQPGSARYHAEQDDSENDPRFAKYKPGSISQSLRDALGMTKNDLPPYIYQMRMLGYPPGHLEEAKISGSGLSFYKGKEVDKGFNSDADDGSVDIEMIIDYPGFNVKPDRHIIDKSDRMGKLPMDERHSKEVMLSYHRHKNELLLKRRREENEKEKQARKYHKPNNTTRQRNDDVREVDMETSDAEDSSDVVITSYAAEKNHKKAVDENVAAFDSEKFKRNLKDDGEGADTEESKMDEVITIEEGEVLSSASCSSDVIIEEQPLLDVGDLDEEELELRRKKILEQLELVDSEDNSDVVCIPDVTPTRIDLTSDADDVEVVCTENKFIDDLRQESEVSVKTENKFCKQNKSKSSVLEDVPGSSFSPSDISSNTLLSLTKSASDEASVKTDGLSSECLVNSFNNSQSESVSPSSPVVAKDYPKSIEEIVVNPPSPENNKEEKFLDEDENCSQPSPEDIFNHPESPEKSFSFLQSSVDVNSCTEASAIGHDLSLKPSNNDCISEDKHYSSKNIGRDLKSTKKDEQYLNPPSNNIGDCSGCQEKARELDSEVHSSNCDSTERCYQVAALEADKKEVDKCSSSPTECESQSQVNPDESLNSTTSGKNLPHRSKFAEGITQIDSYSNESQSSGVFKKIKKILEDSPRQRGNTS